MDSTTQPVKRFDRFINILKKKKKKKSCSKSINDSDSSENGFFTFQIRYISYRKLFLQHCQRLLMFLQERPTSNPIVRSQSSPASQNLFLFIINAFQYYKVLERRGQRSSKASDRFQIVAAPLL